MGDAAAKQLRFIHEELSGRKRLPVLAMDLRMLACDFLGRTPVESPDEPRLYNAALVNHEGLRIEALSWLQPAWKAAPSHKRVVECLMHCLTCEALGEQRMAVAARAWLRSAVELNRETRPHFTRGFRDELLGGHFSPALLQKVSELRQQYEALDDYEGPYPPEAFPFHYFAPEKVVLAGPQSAAGRALWPEVEELLVSLSTEL
jgi:hypothetical protein